MFASYPKLSRRQWMGATAAGVCGFSASGWLDVLAARAADAPRPARKTACIVLFMSGGMAQTESWDMKPESPVEQARGPFRPIQTAVPGIQICQHLPRLARMTGDLALLRGMSTTGEHGAGAKLVHHAGLFPTAAPILKKPGIGGVISAALADPDFGIPTHVVLGGRGLLDRDLGDGGFLGARHNPMNIPEPVRGLESLQTHLSPGAFQERMRLFEELERGFAQQHRLNTIDAHRVGYENAVNFMRSSHARAFNLDHEPASLRDRYGRNQFGQGCLMARRLVEIGIPFVEVKFQVFLHPRNINGASLPWDTHTDLADSAQVGLPILDAAMSSLIADLKDRGMFDDTLVLCMSEMGRNPRDPRPGAKPGRGHYPRVWTAVMAGAGLRTGQVVGRSSEDGAEIADRPISAAELLATICTAVGIDPTLEFSTRDGMRMDAPRSPQQAMAAGAPIRLLGSEPPLVREVLG